MQGYRLSSWGTPPRLEPVHLPEPTADQVLVTVEGAGLCHSDVHVIDAPPGALSFSLPFTLGHEVAGRVAQVGASVRSVQVGDPVLVYGPWGCGDCPRCAQGYENYCDRRGTLGFSGLGLGRDGGLADAVLVPSERHLEPLGDLDPVQAAPLTDAGLTSYHAVAGCRQQLGPDATAVVIGVGGLGHLAIQILRAITDCTVIAVDVRDEALALAESFGAHGTVRAGHGAECAITKATDGRGADAVFDFVGSSATLALATQVLRADGDLVLVGSGGGELLVRKGTGLPQGARLSLPFWGSRTELSEVVALARAGKLRAEVERFALCDVYLALERLRAGTLTGRAVLVPG
jgi:propanol-preferring alcohol dehydrogenase